MSFFEETHQQQLVSGQADQLLIQMPKIVIQPGPSPFSYRSKHPRTTGQFSPNNNSNDPLGSSGPNKIQIVNVNMPPKPKTNTIQLNHSQQQLIFMEKTGMEDQQQIFQ
jgi:hypothetical protein